MNTNLKCFDLLRAGAAAAVILLAPGCGSESPPAAGPAPQPQPPAQTAVVQLGSFGGSVTLAQAASGTWTLNGQPISSNAEVEGDNGLSYRLTLEAGMWMAEFVPAPLAVDLGTSGEEVSLQQQEDGSYQLDEMPVTDGQRVESSEGVQYELEQSPAGDWEASFVAMSLALQLGSSGGTVILTSTEAGTWVDADGMPVASGDTIERGGRTYELRRAAGSWAVMQTEGPDPTTDPTVPTVPGTPPRPDPTPPPPMNYRTVLYHLPLDTFLRRSGLFNISRAFGFGYVPWSVGVAEVGLSGQPVDISARHSGRGRSEELTYAESILEAINLVLGPIDAGDVATDAGRQNLIDRFWSVTSGELDLLFQAGAFRLSQGDTSAETVEILVELRDALSSESAFETYFSSQIAAESGLTAAQFFGLTKRLVALGSTTTTRFGVIRVPVSGLRNPSASAVLSQGLGSRSAAYAYSPLAATPAAAMPTTGTATYNGHTWGISESAYEAYSGDISLQVDFAARTLSNLRGTDGVTMQLNSTDLDQIALPTAGVPSGETSISQFEGSGSATYTYSGGSTATASGWGWSGQFVRSGSTAAAGALGSWTLRNELTGSFGADRAP